MRVREGRITGLLGVNGFLLEDLLAVFNHLRKVEFEDGDIAREGKSKASDQGFWRGSEDQKFKPDENGDR